MNYEVIVNKENPINDYDIPTNLTEIGMDSAKIIERKTFLENKTAINFNKMVEECNKHFKNKIIPNSGFRTIKEQQEILDFYLDPNQRGLGAYNSVALPKTSEHHTGLAIDVAMIKNGVYTDDLEDTEEEIKWLHNNCYKYGFILRYPKGKENITGYSYEPWHFRYVGDIAEYLTKNNLTLEEYQEMKKHKHK